MKEVSFVHLVLYREEYDSTNQSRQPNRGTRVPTGCGLVTLCSMDLGSLVDVALAKGCIKTVGKCDRVPSGYL